MLVGHRKITSYVIAIFQSGFVRVRFIVSLPYQKFLLLLGCQSLLPIKS